MNTGERPILETWFENMRPELKFAYQFTSDFVKNKSILDYGCGGGYGTEYLSRFTDEMVNGYDVDKMTIKINKNFFNKNNLRFIDNKAALGCYDLVVACQFIEHLKDMALNNCLMDIGAKYLNAGGTFICSTPNRLITSRGVKKPLMVFHEKEYSPEELKNLLERYFKNVILFGQYYEGVSINDKLSFKQKILNNISQVELVRMIGRCTPSFIKYLIMGFPPNNKDVKFTLRKDNLEDCGIIIAMGDRK